MQINLHLLRIFFEVAQERSFSKAATKLFISQPAVSKAVRELERQLGLPLLERPVKGTRGVLLSEGGEAIFDHARGIFALERAAVEEVQSRIAEQCGRLTIGASTTIAGYWLSQFLVIIAKDAPNIQLEVRVGNTASIEHALISCEIDAALVEGPVRDERIQVTHWRDDPMCVVASTVCSLGTQEIINAEQLSEQTWIMREAGSGTRKVVEHLMNIHKIKPKRIIKIWSNEGIARAVAADLGVSLLPHCVVAELKAIGEIVTLRYPINKKLSRPLYWLKLGARPESPLLRKLGRVLYNTNLVGPTKPAKPAPALGARLDAGVQNSRKLR